MKLLLYLILFSSSFTFAQVRDTRAYLKMDGPRPEINVLPNGNLWMTCNDSLLFYTESIYSDWHILKHANTKQSIFSEEGFVAYCISFFNNHEAILQAGIICGGKRRFYYTNDTCKTFQQRYLPGSDRSYTLFIGTIDSKHSAWIVKCSDTLYSSINLGVSWQIMSSSSDCKNISYVEMTTATHGIAIFKYDLGRLSAMTKDGIYLTTNNWKTHALIATPFDQKKYTSDSYYNLNGISTITIWNKYIVVNQAGHIFYSEKNNIDWKTFPIDIIDYKLDKEAQQLFAITKSKNVILFSDPLHYKILTKTPFRDHLYLQGIANHSLYALAGWQTLYKISVDTITHTEFYTSDYKIKRPDSVMHVANLLIGTERKSIYISDKNGKDWYRKKITDFNIAEFSILNDSSLILWDSYKNHLFSLADNSVKEYIPHRPFDDFLKYPIKSFTMQVSCQGHSAGTGDKIIYTKEKNTDSFSVSLVKRQRRSWGNDEYKDDTTVRYKVSATAIKACLDNINNDPSFFPSIAAFNITEIDKNNYTNLLENEWQDRLKRYSKNSAKPFFSDFPQKLNIISNNTIRAALDWSYSYSTTSCELNISIVNDNDDTILISNTNPGEASPWDLPWTCRYKNIVFKSYDIKFSNFIKFCKPPQYKSNRIFSNSYFLIHLAQYVYNYEQP